VRGARSDRRPAPADSAEPARPCIREPTRALLQDLTGTSTSPAVSRAAPPRAARFRKSSDFQGLAGVWRAALGGRTLLTQLQRLGGWVKSLVDVLPIGTLTARMPKQPSMASGRSTCQTRSSDVAGGVPDQERADLPALGLFLLLVLWTFPSHECDLPARSKLQVGGDQAAARDIGYRDPITFRPQIVQLRSSTALELLRPKGP